MEMTALVWILTYAIHSTVLIGSVWTLTKLLPKMSLSLQESLWRVALLGGLLTTTVQLSTDVTPPWGHFDLPAELQTHPVASAATVDPAVEPVVQRRIVQHDAGDVTITTIRQSKAPAVAQVAAPGPIEPSKWPWVILGLVGAGSVFALARLGLGARRLRAKLRGRRDVIEDPLLEKFFELCQEAELTDKKRVRLTASDHLRSPVALWSREVVIPERAIERLTVAQQHGMLAHELHHVMRRDPQWSVLTAVVEALFFFQPLNHVARRKLQDLAEFQCDDWAARAAGGGTHLAKCLAEVAGWLENERPLSAVTVAMADGDSPVVRRITRLLHGKPSRSGAGSRSPAARAGLGLGLLGITTWLIPGVAPASASAPQQDRGEGARWALAQEDGLDSGVQSVTVSEVPGAPGQRRSQVLIERDDEIVQVHVDRSTARVPQPPEPPQPHDRIVLRGFVGDSFPFGGGCGSVDIDIDLEDFEADIEGVFGLGFPFSEGCAPPHPERALQRERRHRRKVRRRAERALERAERHRERAVRDQARARRALESARRHRERADAEHDSVYEL